MEKDVFDFVTKDCAFEKVGGCIALKDKQCFCCHFFKTREELEEGRDKARLRINELPPEEKIYISRKYYEGRGIG